MLQYNWNGKGWKGGLRTTNLVIPSPLIIPLVGFKKPSLPELVMPGIPDFKHQAINAESSAVKNIFKFVKIFSTDWNLNFHLHDIMARTNFSDLKFHFPNLCYVLGEIELGLCFN